MENDRPDDATTQALGALPAIAPSGDVRRAIERTALAELRLAHGSLSVRASQRVARVLLPAFLAATVFVYLAWAIEFTAAMRP